MIKTEKKPKPKPMSAEDHALLLSLKAWAMGGSRRGGVQRLGLDTAFTGRDMRMAIAGMILLARGWRL